MIDLDELIEKEGRGPGKTGPPPPKVAARGNRGRLQKAILVVNLIVCPVAAGVTAWRMAVASGSATAWGLFLIAVLLWNLSPYAGLAYVALLVYRRWQLRCSIAMLAGTLVIAVSGVYVVFWSFGPGSDPQSGLIFIFLPLAQWISCGLTVGLASHIRPLREINAGILPKSPKSPGRLT